jgi:hypothetical protein
MKEKCKRRNKEKKRIEQEGNSAEQTAAQEKLERTR